MRNKQTNNDKYNTIKMGLSRSPIKTNTHAQSLNKEMFRFEYV